MMLSEKLTALRKKHGMSQEELAARLNVSRQTVSRWENGIVVPDAYNLLELSKVFGVTSDYLLNDDYNTDDDLPKVKTVKKDNHILHMNLTRIAIIVQASFLNAAMQPFPHQENWHRTIEMLIKLIPILLSSIWMAHNLKYEKDEAQYKKNVKIELVYCLTQAGFFLFGFLGDRNFTATLLLMGNLLFYLLYINPKYMNRKFVKGKNN